MAKRKREKATQVEEENRGQLDWVAYQAVFKEVLEYDPVKPSEEFLQKLVRAQKRFPIVEVFLEILQKTHRESLRLQTLEPDREWVREFLKVEKAQGRVEGALSVILAIMGSFER